MEQTPNTPTHINRIHDNVGRPTEWLVATTHGIECGACNQAVSAAVSIAKATGSVGSTHTDGYHVAKVSRKATR